MKNIYICLVISLIIYYLPIQAQVPYAWYPLNGNAVDSSGNGLNGTIYGSPVPTTNRFNQAGMAMLFNGSNDYIVLPAIFDFPIRSISVWFYATKAGNAINENVIYDADNNNVQNGASSMEVNSTGSLPDFDLNLEQFHYIETTDTGTWYHAVMVRTPSVAKFYVNGTLLCTEYNPNGIHSNNQITFDAVIGVDRNFNGNFFGKIDDLRIYNYALSTCEVQDLYYAGSYGLPCTSADTAVISVYDTVQVSIYDTTHFTTYDTLYFSDTIYAIIYDTSHFSTTDTLLIITKLTGINPPNNINTLSVYPNPAHNQIYINTGNYSSMAGYRVEIVNTLGQPFFTSLVNQQLIDVNITGWSSATYLLEIYDNNNALIETRFIVIQ